jgi:hypothetical protein
VLFLMLKEKKRLDIEKSKLLAHLIKGGELSEPEDELVPGIDYPADEATVGALEAFG